MFNKKERREKKEKKEQEKKEQQEEEERRKNAPFRFFDITYEGDIEEFKKLLKKKISFDFKDMGNNTIYLKVKQEDFEVFSLNIQAAQQQSTTIKKYQEISEEIYKGALLSLDKMIK